MSVNSLFDDIKLSVVDRMRGIMENLLFILDFAAEESNLNSLDDLLDSTRVDEL